MNKLNQNQTELLTAVFAAARTSWRGKQTKAKPGCLREAIAEMVEDSYTVESIILEQMVGDDVIEPETAQESNYEVMP